MQGSRKEQASILLQWHANDCTLGAKFLRIAERVNDEE